MQSLPGGFVKGIRENFSGCSIFIRSPQKNTPYFLKKQSKSGGKGDSGSFAGKDFGKKPGGQGWEGGRTAAGRGKFFSEVAISEKNGMIMKIEMFWDLTGCLVKRRGGSWETVKIYGKRIWSK